YSAIATAASTAPGGSSGQVQYNNAGLFGGISGLTSDGTNVTAGSGNLRATSPRITTAILDTNGNELFLLTTTASAVNEFAVANAAAGNNPTLSLTGGDANVGATVLTKGTGRLQIGSGADVSGVLRINRGSDGTARVHLGHFSFTGAEAFAGFWAGNISVSDINYAFIGNGSSEIVFNVPNATGQIHFRASGVFTTSMMTIDGNQGNSVGINNSGTISAQLHVKSIAASRVALRADSAASPSVDIFQATINDTDVVDINSGGVLGQRVGTSTTFARLGGSLVVNTTAVGNVGAGEDDLITFSVPANTLATNGDYLEARFFGTFAGNANNKRVRVKFGATTLFDATALAFNGADWSVTVTIVRTGATTQKATATFVSSSSLLVASTDYTTPAETLSGAVTIKCTGEATADNDIVQEGAAIKWLPNGN
ncbi:MAG: hypothetical protein L0Z53_26955, partial [Acidobacteriales bacterium]|nr:hypothetical protein [Terriglobales bacterium]